MARGNNRRVMSHYQLLCSAIGHINRLALLNKNMDKESFRMCPVCLLCIREPHVILLLFNKDLSLSICCTMGTKYIIS